MIIPKVSIIMSVYNDERFLAASIESMLNQTYTDFEFIIVNDASTDASEKILQTYAEKDNRIQLIKNAKNIGLTQSLNKALYQTKSAYIARQDADDISLPERLERQVKYLDNHAKVGVVGTRYKEINEKGEVISSQRVTFIKQPQDIAKHIYQLNPLFHSSVMIRETCLKECGGYNNTWYYAQDYELWLRLIQKYALANIDHVLAYRRNVPNNISTKKRAKQLDYALQARARYGKKFSCKDWVRFGKDRLKWLLWRRF